MHGAKNAVRKDTGCLESVRQENVVRSRSRQASLTSGMEIMPEGRGSQVKSQGESFWADGPAFAGALKY